MNIFSLESFASQGSKIYVQIFSTNFQKNHDMESYYSIDLMYTHYPDTVSIPFFILSHVLYVLLLYTKVWLHSFII